MSRMTRGRRVAVAALAVTLAVMIPARARGDDAATTLRLRALNARATAPDTYVTVSVDAPIGAWSVEAFEPRAEASIVHHMLVFGCARAAAREDVATGGMFGSGARVKTCADGRTQALLYGWGRGAPPMHTPTDVGFRVGDGAFGALVLEVHYRDALGSDATGESGLDVVLRRGWPKMSASVLAWASYFDLSPGLASTEVRTTCAYDASRELRAFGFRVHTHERGTKVWLDRLVGGDESRPVRVLERDPQLPQEFEQLAAKGTTLVVAAGDVLRVTCSFNTTNETGIVSAGFGAAHEMCNMYVMVYSDEPQYMSCVGRNDGSRGRFTLESGDQPTPAEDMDAVRVHAVSPPGSSKWPADVGGVGGIQVTSDGAHVWMTNRGANVWEAGQDLGAAKTIQREAVVRMNLYTGEVDKAFASNAHVMPHGVREAPDGSIWVTDTALHQVFQYSSDSGTLLRSFGKAGKKLSGDDGFCAPADVLVLEDGSFIVADGYGECANRNRVARFAADGSFAGDFDLAGVPQPAIKVAHQLAYSQVRAEIALADRENSRVLLFESSGAFKRAIDVSAYGYAYGLAWMGSALEGMDGYYVLCWSRDAPTPKTTLVRVFWPGQPSEEPATHAWDLADSGTAFEVPHVLAVQSSKNGGTAAWGPGITVHVGSTTKSLGTNYARLWLGVNAPKTLSAPPARLASADAATPAPSASPTSTPTSALAVAACVIFAIFAITARARSSRLHHHHHPPARRLERVVLVRADDDRPASASDDDALDPPPPPERTIARGQKLARD